MRYFYLYVLLLAEPHALNAKESFMTEYEYGEMLYNNPRGISCAICHGALGEGKMIVSYKENKKNKSILGDDIRTKSLEEMIHSIHMPHTVMPNYYLTDKEIETIYEYLKEKNKKSIEEK